METDASLASPLVLTSVYPPRDDDCACAEQAFLLISPFAPAENDCACSGVVQTLSADKPSAFLYRQVEGAYSAPLTKDFWLALSPYSPQGPSVLNALAWQRWQDFRRPRPLVEPVDYALAEQRLLLPQGQALPARLAPPQTLTVWMHLTSACNLACPYCYVHQSSASMNGKVAMQALERIFYTAQRRFFRGVKIKYAGGEAMLRFPLIQRLASRADKLAQQNNLTLQQVILSNGVRIRPGEAAWMVENGVRLMISLDGVGEVQDRARPYRDGRGSFRDVSRTVDDVLLPSGLRPIISITLTRYNADSAAQAVRWALERDLPISLNFYRQPVHVAASQAAEEQTIIEGMLAAYQVIERLLPRRPLLNGLLDRCQFPAHARPCGAGSSYLVVAPDGTIAPCQMALERANDPASCEDLIAGLEKNSLCNLDVEQKETCRQCPYRYYCAGGCPLEAYRLYGRWDAPSPNCRIYKALLPYALRLEGLRLLKIHGYLL